MDEHDRRVRRACPTHGRGAGSRPRLGSCDPHPLGLSDVPWSSSPSPCGVGAPMRGPERRRSTSGTSPLSSPTALSPEVRERSAPRRGILGDGAARACSSDALANSRSSRARWTTRGRARRGSRALRRRCRDRQDAARLGARAARARRAGFRGPPRALDRPRRHRTPLPPVRRGPAPVGPTARRRQTGWGSRCESSSAPCRCSANARRSRSGAAGARGRALGRRLDARPDRLSRPSRRRPPDPVGRDRPGRRDRSRDRMRDSPTGSDVRSPRRGRLGSSRPRGGVGAARGGDTAPPGTVTQAIVDRSEGNPFFAEELLDGAANGDGAGSLVACATCCCTASPGSICRRRDSCGWRRPSDGMSPTRCCGTLAATGARPARFSARGRRARRARRRPGGWQLPLPARTPGRGRVRDDPAGRAGGAPRAACGRARPQRSCTAAELAPHWAAARRDAEALAASIEAARQAEEAFGLAEAHAHLERALGPWDEVPDAAELAGLDLAELCSWAADLASRTGAAPRAVELGRHAIELIGGNDPRRAALLHVRLGEYLYETGRNAEGLADAQARGRARAGGTAIGRARVCARVTCGRIDGRQDATRSRCRSPSTRSRRSGASALARQRFAHSP